MHRERITELERWLQQQIVGQAELVQRLLIALLARSREATEENLSVDEL